MAEKESKAAEEMWLGPPAPKVDEAIIDDEVEDREDAYEDAWYKVLRGGSTLGRSGAS